MSLSTLPVEIFNQILDHLVQTRDGFYSSVHLRLVNRNFDIEIRHAYGRTPRRLWDRWLILIPGARSKCKFLAKYLLIRPHSRRNAEYAELSYLLNSLVDQLLNQQSGLEDTIEDNQIDVDASRYQFLFVLCLNINLRNLRYGTMPESLVIADLLIAAIYTNQRSVITDILTAGRVNFKTDISVLFADDPNSAVEAPLVAAVKSRNPDIVRILLEHNAPFQDPSVRPSRPYRTTPLLAAVQNNDLPIVTLLLHPPSTLDKADLTYQHALIKSITPDVASQPIRYLLLSRLEIPLASCPYILSEGLRAACRAGNTELITLLIANGAEINTVMDYRQTHGVAAPIAQAALHGQIPAMNLLLSHGAILTPNPEGSVHISVQHIGADALRAVTWGNHWAAAQVLLDAGAAEHMSPNDWCFLFKMASQREESVDVAVKLLDSGYVKLEGLEEVEVEELVEVVREQGNADYMRALARHGLPVGQDV